MPDDEKLLPKGQLGKIEEWCDQVPVLGFSSGRYDLNLIKEHFAEPLADDHQGQSGEKGEHDHVHYNSRLPLS